MPDTNIDTELYCILAIIVIGILFGWLVRLFMLINAFSQELKYLNCEIGRTEGEEKAYWIHRRQRLWLSLIPFVKY